MAEKVKSGTEILNDFFKDLESLDSVDKNIAKKLTELFNSGKLSDINIKNELQKLRDGNKN